MANRSSRGFPFERLCTLAVLAAWALASGCAIGTTAKRAKEGRHGFEQSGVASWYGPGFHGRTTANGETYDMEAMTAAHKQLPFGSVVEVLNRDNGRKTRVRINDRGPFVRGRIIDLSKAAARDIDMLGSGVARVRLRVVSTSEKTAEKRYRVQAGAFGDRAHADAHLKRVRLHFPAAVLESSEGLHRVVITGQSKHTADNIARQLRRHGIEAVVRGG